MDKREPLHMTDDRMRHIRGVAEQAYRIAIGANLGEEVADRMYVMGFVHDIGYALDEDTARHGEIGGEVLSKCGFDFAPAVSLHGQPSVELDVNLAVLDVADMTVNGYGDLVTMSERLADIASRHGGESEVTRKCEELVRTLRDTVPGMVAVAERAVMNSRQGGE